MLRCERKPQARLRHGGASFAAWAGRFYDAGEFRDFAEFTVEDFVKRFAVKARF